MWKTAITYKKIIKLYLYAVSCQNQSHGMGGINNFREFQTGFFIQSMKIKCSLSTV